MSEQRTCEACGMKFSMSDKDLEEEKIPAPGRHLPENCPEGLDLFCPSCDLGVMECKSCRVKQDGQRS